MKQTSQTAPRAAHTLVQRDRRADEGQRQVRVTREGVLISRRLAGIAMHIRVPVAAYRGVALDVSAGREGGACYRLSLAHQDPELDVVLAETQDGGAVAADWKYWANWLDLPRLAARGEALEALEPARPAVERRRAGVAVAKRRPRFLARRKTGVAARTDISFAGEREIVCYE